MYDIEMIHNQGEQNVWQTIVLFRPEWNLY